MTHIENEFIDELENGLLTNTIPVTGGFTNYYGSSTQTQVDNAINAYLTQPGTYSRDYAGFYAALRSFNPSLPADPLTGPPFTAVKADLTATINIGLLLGAGVTYDNLTENALNHYFNELSAAQLGGVQTNYANNNLAQMVYYFTKTANIPINTGNPLSSYQELFDAFVGGTAAEFQGKLEDFYNRMVSEYGYFLPSQMFEQWVEELNLQVNPSAVVDSGTGSEKTLIIFELLELVKEMIDTLQDVSTAQVQRLTFYANWQQAYTRLLSKIPVVTFSKLRPRVSGNDDAVVTAVQGIGSINQTFTEKARGYRDSVSDETKGHQSAVNQTKEALNAQASLATTLLQNMSTILQSIFQ